MLMVLERAEEGMFPPLCSGLALVWWTLLTPPRLPAPPPSVWTSSCISGFSDVSGAVGVGLWNSSKKEGEQIRQRSQTTSLLSHAPVPLEAPGQARASATMAIVQTLPVPLEPAPETATTAQAPAMGSVSSLISGRPCPGGPVPSRHHGPPGPAFFRQQDGLLRGGYEAQEPLCPAVPPRKTVPGTTFTYTNEDFRAESPSSPSSDIEDMREQRARNAHLRGPPPKLIPVSGKLEKVYEDRQRHWQREREAQREDGAAQAQRAQRAQQLLQLQVFQLQQEKRQLQDDFAQLLQEREQLERRCATFEREQRELGPRLEETKWEVCQKSGEISLLKQQLKESQAELVQKGSELVALRVALREARAALRVSEGWARGLQEAARARELELEACSQELQRHRQEAEQLREKAGQLDTEAAGLREPPVPPATADPFLLAESDEAKAQRVAAGFGGSLRAQVERLRAELQQERRRGEEQRDSFEGERLAWQAEKEQVIRYQKQLQHNYIQMYRRNRQLEQELQQLSLELEARELADLGLAEPAPCICLEEITATEI
ncbi:leucine zipper putative tumor suppressor 2 isoform X6 [Artibeus jamaicensis]|uniref:leucine zipper putative tumor suppressor 2 isoform X6 n=1 Tax=Artibeus jamaicensis TaxID=9417 RepID=UPI00235AB2E0|nr:leucine zipper putative tumor suppressor 2 isoform X6 [Artibeus jamaicensis]